MGHYANKGQEWEAKGCPMNVNTYDFPDKKKGKASPYGIFDLTNNEGGMNVGMSKDTTVFAVERRRRGWKGRGILKYPKAKKWLITADGGGSKDIEYVYGNEKFNALLTSLG